MRFLASQKGISKEVLMTDIQRKEIPWEFEGAEAEIIYHQFRDLPLKTLFISLPEPRLALSSREGFRKARFVINNFNPPELWEFIHQDYRFFEDSILADLGLREDEVCFLSTGLDIEKFALVEESFKEFRVCAFVTAGVGSNAMRIGVDKAGSVEREGKFERVGTINTIALTNCKLSEGAMVRSIITATEAKTIALQDLGVMSSYNPELQATGTGTDTVVIVSGHGPKINYMGGHGKAGELLARVVTKATKDAIEKQL